MSVVIETTLGDITVDLFLKERPRACLNFLKLCKMKYYNYNLFHTISRGFIAQTGDPTGSRRAGESIYGTLEGPSKRYFESEKNPRIKHTHLGLLSFVGNEDGMIGSQFFITLGSDLTYLDGKHCVFGEVMEGLDVIDLINETICDADNRPYKDVRITHTVILEDPFSDLKGMRVPSRSPSPSAERLKGGRIGADEDIDDTEGKSAQEISEMLAEREAKARATILEMVGDLPDAEMAPPENVLFICKLNPVTTDDDLEIIFSRFGKIVSCEVIRDRKSGDSLQYAFVEFNDKKSCEDAYFKMDNVLIDDRRIHVDFSQSVSKIKWHGKGRGVTTYDDKGKKVDDIRNEIGKGNYKMKEPNRSYKPRPNEPSFNKKNRSEERKDYRRGNDYSRRSSRALEDRRKDSSSNRYYEKKQNFYETERSRSPHIKSKSRNNYTRKDDGRRRYRKASPSVSDESSDQENRKRSRRDERKKEKQTISSLDRRNDKQKKSRSSDSEDSSDVEYRKQSKKRSKKKTKKLSSDEEARKMKKKSRRNDSSSEDDRSTKKKKKKKRRKNYSSSD